MAIEEAFEMATLFKDVLMLDGGGERAKRGHLLVSKGRITQVLGILLLKYLSLYLILCR